MKDDNWKMAIFTLICFALSLLAFIILLPGAIPTHTGETLQEMDRMYNAAHIRAVCEVACSSGQQCVMCHHLKKK